MGDLHPLLRSISLFRFALGCAWVDKICRCHSHPFILCRSFTGSRDGALSVLFNTRYENHDGNEKNEALHSLFDRITLITFFIIIFWTFLGTCSGSSPRPCSADHLHLSRHVSSLPCHRVKGDSPSGDTNTGLGHTCPPPLFLCFFLFFCFFLTPRILALFEVTKRIFFLRDSKTTVWFEILVFGFWFAMSEHHPFFVCCMCLWHLNLVRFLVFDITVLHTLNVLVWFLAIFFCRYSKRQHTSQTK